MRAQNPLLDHRGSQDWKTNVATSSVELEDLLPSTSLHVVVNVLDTSELEHKTDELAASDHVVTAITE